MANPIAENHRGYPVGEPTRRGGPGTVPSELNAAAVPAPPVQGRAAGDQEPAVFNAPARGR